MSSGQQGREISLLQLASQWKNKPHKFEVNVWNFEVKIGRAAVGIFQKSFDLKRFNSRGSTPWTARKIQGDGHPLMVETGSLKNSIKWKHLSKKSVGSSGVLIYTDPNGFNNTASHRGFCFAAVHNAPKSLHTRYNHMKDMPRRQFMGDSTELDEVLKKLSIEIFEGFPK